MGFDVSAVVDHASLVEQLRALKAACGRSTTQIAAAGGLSTSGIEGMLAGANFPTEETVARFARGCGVDPRPWTEARYRAAASQPRASRVPREVREELEELRARNAELTSAVAEYADRVEALEERAARSAEAQSGGSGPVDSSRELVIRLASRMRPNFTLLPWEGSGLMGQKTERYRREPVDKALKTIHDLLKEGDVVGLLMYLAALPPFDLEPWRIRDGFGAWEAGYGVEGVDQFFRVFRAEVESGLQ